MSPNELCLLISSITVSPTNTDSAYFLAPVVDYFSDPPNVLHVLLLEPSGSSATQIMR